MTPQEAALLNTFLDQLTSVKGISKDTEADALISKAVARQPDAAYLLVQRALLLEQALNAAKEQIAKLESERDATRAPQAEGRFLGDMNAWGRTPSAPSRSSASAPAGVSPGSAPPAAGPAAPQQAAGGGRSFLASAAATAAGVVGGAFLFQGIGNLLGHGGGGFLPHTAAALPPTDLASSHDSATFDDLADATDPDLALDSSLDGQDFADQGFDDDSSLA